MQSETSFRLLGFSTGPESRHRSSLIVIKELPECSVIMPRTLSAGTEVTMLSSIVRLLMIAAGLVTSWFVAKDAPIFGIAQLIMTLLLISLIVAVMAFWPQRWTAALNRLYRFR
jgi:hypothetical protein